MTVRALEVDRIASTGPARIRAGEAPVVDEIVRRRRLASTGPARIRAGEAARAPRASSPRSPLQRGLRGFAQESRVGLRVSDRVGTGFNGACADSRRRGQRYRDTIGGVDYPQLQRGLRGFAQESPPRVRARMRSNVQLQRGLRGFAQESTCVGGRTDAPGDRFNGACADSRRRVRGPARRGEGDRGRFNGACADSRRRGLRSGRRARRARGASTGPARIRAGERGACCPGRGPGPRCFNGACADSRRRGGPAPRRRVASSCSASTGPARIRAGEDDPTRPQTPRAKRASTGPARIRAGEGSRQNSEISTSYEADRERSRSDHGIGTCVYPFVRDAGPGGSYSILKSFRGSRAGPGVLRPLSLSRPASHHDRDALGVRVLLPHRREGVTRSAIRRAHVDEENLVLAVVDHRAQSRLQLDELPRSQLTPKHAVLRVLAVSEHHSVRCRSDPDTASPGNFGAPPLLMRA